MRTIVKRSAQFIARGGGTNYPGETIGVNRKTAKMLIAQFFTAMEAELAAAPGEEVEQGVAINLWRALVAWIRRIAGRLSGPKAS